MTEHRKDERWVLTRPYVAEAIARAKRELRVLKADRKLAAYDRFTDSRGTAA